MANISTPPKSALKSPNSSKRNPLTVSFQDYSPSDSLISLRSNITTPNANGRSRSNWSLKTSPSSKADLNVSSSSADGLSIEEITCLDVDDILPKTDYTYARTASYSPKFLRKKRYISPNMSRRRVKGPPSSFLSDEEDDYDDEFDNVDINTSSNKNDFEKIVDTEDPERQHRSRRRTRMITSSPLSSHKEYHISSHDHYYDGMLLRSGSHVHGAKRALRESSFNSFDGDYINGSPVLTPTYRLDVDGIESHRKNGRTVTTITTTTTDTIYDEDEDNSDIDDAVGRKLRTKSRKDLKVDSKAHQESQRFEDSEMKLMLDENETEKIKGKSHIRLHHMDGLDYDEDISDVEDISSNYHYSKRKGLTYQQSAQTSLVSRITSFFIMIVTTVTSTITESTKLILSPVATTTSIIVTSPIRWIGRAVISTCSWILWNSSSVLLWDIEAKHRRKRGCCCCFLPFLLLLPLALLAGHYLEPMKEQMRRSWTVSESTISSYWTNLWISPTPNFVPPPKQSDSGIDNQLDMTQLNQHIHQIVVQVMSQHQKESPPGLTVEQVEAIVKAMLASQIDNTNKKFDGDISELSGLFNQDMSDVWAALTALEKNIQESDRSAQVLSVDLDAAKNSLERMSQDQRNEWLGITEMLEGKFLDMRNELNDLTNQNLALAAMLKNCCQNNSVIMEMVHSHMMNYFSQIDKDEDSAAFAGLMSMFGNQYVGRDELDSKLSAVAAEITEKMQIALAQQAEEIQTRTNEISQEPIIPLTGGIDEVTVKGIVEDALLKFSADGIGVPDFALESAGGSILNVRCSETYYRKTALISVFGLPLWYTSNSPRTVIQPSVHPGECWAFKGSSGFLVIQLSQPIQPTGFTLEHIPRSLAPSGNIDSAPQAFSVFGLSAENDMKGINLGNYTYSDAGRPVQHFPIQNRHPGVYQYVELRVLSNYGSIEYTCIYRFRVHGLP